MKSPTTRTTVQLIHKSKIPNPNHIEAQRHTSVPIGGPWPLQGCGLKCNQVPSCNAYIDPNLMIVIGMWETMAHPLIKNDAPGNPTSFLCLALRRSDTHRFARCLTCNECSMKCVCHLVPLCIIQLDEHDIGVSHGLHIVTYIYWYTYMHLSCSCDLLPCPAL